MSKIKTIQVKAFNKEEAASQVDFNIMGDATQAWKTAGLPVDEKDMKEFCAEYLDKKLKKDARNGNGYMITLKAGVADSKERPYKIENAKNEKGKRKYVTAYLLKDKETDTILDIVKGTKAEAMEAAKEIFASKEYTGEIVATYIHVVEEGEPKAFVGKYSPSKTTVLGSYYAFGFEKE